MKNFTMNYPTEGSSALNPYVEETSVYADENTNYAEKIIQFPQMSIYFEPEKNSAEHIAYRDALEGHAFENISRAQCVFSIAIFTLIAFGFLFLSL